MAKFRVKFIESGPVGYQGINGVRILNLPLKEMKELVPKFQEEAITVGHTTLLPSHPLFQEKIAGKISKSYIQQDSEGKTWGVADIIIGENDEPMGKIGANFLLNGASISCAFMPVMKPVNSPSSKRNGIPVEADIVGGTPTHIAILAPGERPNYTESEVTLLQNSESQDVNHRMEMSDDGFIIINNFNNFNTAMEDNKNKPAEKQITNDGMLDTSYDSVVTPPKKATMEEMMERMLSMVEAIHVRSEVRETVSEAKEEVKEKVAEEVEDEIEDEERKKKREEQLMNSLKPYIDEAVTKAAIKKINSFKSDMLAKVSDVAATQQDGAKMVAAFAKMNKQ